MKSKKRKPYRFWKKWGNFESEMKKEIQKEYKDELGNIIKRAGEYQTTKQLKANGRTDLETVAYKHHGGYSKARERMGHALERMPNGFWANWDNFENAMKKEIQRELQKE